jgi:hypothetical protein
MRKKLRAREVDVAKCKERSEKKLAVLVVRTLTGVGTVDGRVKILKEEIYIDKQVPSIEQAAT